MRDVLEYLCDRIKVVCCLLGMEGVTFFALWLQGTSFHKVSYAVLLSCFILFLVGIADFIRYTNRRRSLRMLENSIAYSMQEMPEPGSFTEKNYQRILNELFDAKSEVESAGNIARKEMLDYYGLWAHQIKTPISAMRLLLQAQKDGLIAGEADCAAMGKWNTQLSMELFRIEQYVDMVLSYLRMEDMGKDLVLEEYDVDKIVNQAVKKFSKEFIYRKIKLEKSDIEMKAMTDEKWTLFAVEQILSNALKYTPEGGCIRICRITGRNILSIEDSGIGIRKEDLPRVCEKGFTGYNGREDKKSTGIGLYLCKSIMDRLNHEMAIESEVGHGTKVYLNFEREAIGIE